MGFNPKKLAEDYKKKIAGLQEQEAIMKSMFDQINTQAMGESNKGDFYAMLGELLTKQLNEGVTNLGGMKQSSEGAINRSFDQSRTNMKEDLASRGMGGSGAALAALGQLGGQRATALGDNSLKLDSMNQDYKNNALSQIFNLNSFGAGADQQQFNNLFGWYGANVDQMNFNSEMQFRKDSQPSGFAQFLGNLLGMGTQIGSAYATKG